MNILTLKIKFLVPSNVIIDKNRISDKTEIVNSRGNAANNKKTIIYEAKMKNIPTDVIIKETKKTGFWIREILILWTLTMKRTIDHSKCKSCGQEVCNNIIKFYGCYEENGNICVVLEKADYNLLEFFKEKSPDKKELKQIFLNLAQTVKCVHANSIAHLDLSAPNVLNVKDGKDKVRLADFGESEIFQGTNISTNPLNPRKSFKVAPVKLIVKQSAIL